MMTNGPLSDYDAIERNVGIQVYLSDDPGFAGVVKARYSDFIVHEVNRMGQMARLESLTPSTDVPKVDDPNNQVEGKKRKHPDNDEEAESSSPSMEEILVSCQAKLSSWVGDESSQEVMQMIRFWEEQKKESGNKKDMHDPQDLMPKKFILLPPIESKEIRTAVHQWIRSSDLSQYAVGDTFEGQIRIWHKSFERESSNFGKFDRVGKPRNVRCKEWPDNRPDFLQFVLYKENIDTASAIKDVLKRVKGKTRIGYAGMKDKRGITSQFITLYRKQPEDILSLNTPHRGNGCGNSKYGNISVIRVGNFEYVDKELSLGMLQGNRFDIVLRNIDAVGNTIEEKKNSIDAAAKAFQRNGFINYFGMQRFGKDHDTHKVGIEILKSNFQAAIDMIMQPKTDEFPRTNDARQEWCSRFNNIPPEEESKRRDVERECATKVLHAMGRFMTSEVAILHSLKRDPLNYRKAFSNIPKNTRLMFLHAVQSILWNQMTSFRIGTMGKDHVCVGDLVQISDSSSDENGSGTSGRKGKGIHVVTQKDVDSKAYGMTDVVIPLVGTKVEYPQNETSTTMLESLLSDMGISKDSFENIQDRELSLGGDYRKLLCQPSDVDYTIIEYAASFQPLIPTDLMKIHKEELTTIPPDDIDNNDNHTHQGDNMHIGMVVGFTLPPSSYATIALRELTKRPTSSDYQRQLQLNGPCEGKLIGK